MHHTSRVPIPQDNENCHHHKMNEAIDAVACGIYGNNLMGCTGNTLFSMEYTVSENCLTHLM